MGALVPWWSPGTCFSEERVSGCDATCESESVSHSVVSDSATLPAPLSMGFSRQEYWSVLPCPPPGDLPNPGIEPRSPALQADSLPLCHLGYPIYLQVELLHHMGFPGGSDSRESACNVGDLALIPGLGRSPGGGHGNTLQYSYLENPHGQRCLAGYSPWDHKESDTTERLSTAHGHSMFNTLRKCKADFQSSYTILHSHQ